MNSVSGRRRAALFFAAAIAVLVVPAHLHAQTRAKVARVGYLAPTSQPAREEVFREELRRLGYGKENLVIEYRSADGKFERLPELARELVGVKPDVIVAVVTQAAIAAKSATSTIPIVMVGVADPVGSGLVATLGRPGGNVTGNSSLSADVVGKQMELLRELFPKVSRITLLSNPANTVFHAAQLAEATAAAAKLRIQLQVIGARTPDELDGAFNLAVAERTGALLVLGDPLFTAHFARIASLAIKHRVPALSAARENAEAGALMSYGPSFADLHRGAAAYVDKLLKGARPADLPVEQASKFELIINVRTARALGVEIPSSIATRADHVIR